MIDCYESVTRKIIAALEAGTPPWIRPWAVDPAEAVPCNLASGRPYRGVNVLLLNLQAAARGYARNRWLTYRQALAVGAQVRKGESGTPVVFFSMKEVRGDAEPGADGSVREYPLLRQFVVFNADQIDGLPEQPRAEPAWTPQEAAERLIEASGADISHGGSKAFYVPSEDRIQLPARAAFPDDDSYYATALHELTHWTGHSIRCNRPLLPRQALDAYGFEELVAEMGAAFLCAHVGIPGRLEHASYIESWLKALRQDKRLIFTAASRAQAAADYLMAFVQPEAAEVASVPASA